MVHIVPMDWTSWTAGQSVTVFVYSNADSVRAVPERRLAGVEDDQRHDRSPSMVGYLRAGTLQAKATKGGAVVATDTVKTPARRRSWR